MTRNYISLFLFFVCLYQIAKADFAPNPFIINQAPAIEVDYEQDLKDKIKYIKEQNAKIFEEEVKGNEELFEQSFAQAPDKIQVIVRDMLRGHAYALRYKNILLAGPTGTGKSTLAQAIAYKLKRRCIVINAPDLLGHYRDQAAENIRKLFKQLREDEDKPVLILEEINALTDGHTSEHSDTKHTAMQLWTLLDGFKDDKDFLLIGTTNVTKKMPHQLQSRFEGRTIVINNPTLAARKNTLVLNLKKLNVLKDESCTDNYFNELAQKIAGFSQRRIEALIDNALYLYSKRNPNATDLKLSKECLEQSYIEIMEDIQTLCDYTEHVTDEDRRHRESLAQNKAQHEENKELQIRMGEWSLLFQAHLAATGSSPHVPSLCTTVDALHQAKAIALPARKPIEKIVKTSSYWGLQVDTKIEAADQNNK